MKADSEGFLYPQVDTDSCNSCRRCEKVCPSLNRVQNRSYPEVFACYNTNDEVREQSSSGGLFSLLAEQILAQGGVVFGAAFNEQFEVEHRSIDSPEELGLLRGSKYVQSRLGETFKQVKSCLEAGRLVLFTGTPCQVAGLKKGLAKEYSNLLTADVVCKGVPSPLVFRLYKEELEQQFQSPVKSFSFRNKTHGWQKFHTYIELGGETYLEHTGKDIYMQGFRAFMYVRPSCHACCANNFRSGSDLTLGDYWGIRRIHPELFDDQGASLVLIHTQLGKEYWRRIEPMLEYRESDLNKAVRSNGTLVLSADGHPKRHLFFEQLGKVPFSELLADFLKPDRSFKGWVTRLTRKLMLHRLIFNHYTLNVHLLWFFWKCWMLKKYSGNPKIMVRTE